VYDKDGKRLNTKEFRAKERLQDERQNLIELAQAIYPHWRPPAGIDLVVYLVVCWFSFYVYILFVILLFF